MFTYLMYVLENQILFGDGDGDGDGRGRRGDGIGGDWDEIATNSAVHFRPGFQSYG